MLRLVPSPELVTLELARLVETGTEWERRFNRYDRLIDAGLSCEEAASIVSDTARREAAINETRSAA